MASSLCLRELFRSEIETSQQENLISELIHHGILLEKLIDLFEEKTLTTIYTQIDSLGKTSLDLLADDFMKAKRALLDSLAWMNLCKNTYCNVSKGPLDFKAKVHFEKIVRQLQERMAVIDCFIPQVISSRKIMMPSDYRIKAKIAFDNTNLILREELSNVPVEDAETHAKVQLILDSFLSRQKATFEEIADYANIHQKIWEQEIVTNGRGLLITEHDRFPFPLIYSVKGNLYVIMVIASHYIAQGKQKIATRTVNFKTGEIEALLQPKEFFLEDAPPEITALKEENAFWDTWRDADMLMQFQNTPGILQVRDRLVFEMDGKKKLYLFEDYYRKKTLDWVFANIDTELKPLEFRQKYKIAHDLLLGLKSLHAADVIHHDIKPNNILLNIDLKGELTAVLSDLDIACYTYDKLVKDIARLVPHWSAPEFAYVQKNSETPPEAYYAASSPKIDVWAIGLIFFILFNEKLTPWNSLENEAEVFDIICRLKPGWIPRHAGDERYFPLLEKMLEVDPVKRCTSAEALALLEQMI